MKLLKSIIKIWISAALPAMAQLSPPELPPVQPGGVMYSIFNLPPVPSSIDWYMPNKTNVMTYISTNLVDWEPYIGLRAYPAAGSLSNVSFTIIATSHDRVFFKVE